MSRPDHDTEQAEIQATLEQQQRDGESHDRSLIVERLAWTPEERL